MRILNDNVLSRASLSATTTAAESFVNNLANGNLFDYWKPAATSTQIITVNFDVPTTVDAFALAGHNLFSAGIFSITLRLYDEVDALLSTSAIAVSSDKNILQSITSTLASSAEIQMNVISELPYLSSMYLGESIYTVRAPEFGEDIPVLNNNSKVSKVTSELGIVLGIIIEETQGIDIDFSLKNMPLDWVLSNWVPFVETSLDTPFFISLSDLVPNVIYATAKNKKLPTITSPTRATIKLSFEGVL